MLQINCSKIKYKLVKSCLPQSFKLSAIFQGRLLSLLVPSLPQLKQFNGGWRLLCFLASDWLRAMIFQDLVFFIDSINDSINELII